MTDNSPPKVEMYHSMLCPYCHAARRLLDRKGVAYTLIGVDMDPARRREMTARAEGRTSVPQIFVDGVGVGGFDDIAALDEAGRLDALLGLTDA